MERLTEYHCGVAVIKDKSRPQDAMAKLAAYEDAEEKKYCCLCKWHDNYTGACCNGESEYRADFTDLSDTCEKWGGLNE